jgi:hypothetical protein
LPPIDDDSDALFIDDGGSSMEEFPVEGLLLAEEQTSLPRKRRPYRKRGGLGSLRAVLQELLQVNYMIPPKASFDTIESMDRDIEDHQWLVDQGP